MSMPRMTKRERTVIVWTVLYDDPKRSDGLTDRIMRFEHEQSAARFAWGRTHYGKPCTIQREEVPARIAERWSIVTN